MTLLAPLLALSAGPILQDEASTLAYEFTLYAAPPALHVTLELLGAPTGRTELHVSREAGGARGGLDLADVSARVEAGALPLLEVGDASTRWTFEHAPGEPLRVEYTLPLNAHRTSLDPTDYNRPMVGADYVHLIGSLALLRPTHLAEWKPVSMEVRWTGLREAGWQTVSSFGVGDVSFTTSPVGLCGSIFVAGRDLRLHERTIREQEVVVALAGRNWPFSDERFVDLSCNIVDHQRRFFRDDSQPWFLVNLTPIGVPDAGRLIRSGLGLTDSFDVFLLDGSRLEDEPRPGQALAHTLAHEMFHNWNGNLIVRADPTALGTWFSEGFTDLYARRLLYRSGSIDLATYARILNGTIAEYALSPARDVPNSVFLDKQWEDPTIHRMAYLRGDLVGSLIDHAIRSHSNGRRSLDDLMRALASEARASLDGERARVSTEDLLARIEQLTDATFAQRLRAIVIDGAPIELPLDLFEPCLAGRLGEIWTTDPGFDTDAIRRTGVVQGVRAGSAAHAAGLRNDQRCTSYEFSDEAGKPVVTVKVLVNGQEQELRFSAAGDAVAVPVFVPRADAPARCAAL